MSQMVSCCSFVTKHCTTLWYHQKKKHKENKEDVKNPNVKAQHAAQFDLTNINISKAFSL